MARQHLIESRTIQNITEPYKEMINDFSQYMAPVLTDQEASELITNIGKSVVLIREYMEISKYREEYFSNLLISDINSCL